MGRKVVRAVLLLPLLLAGCVRAQAPDAGSPAPPLQLQPARPQFFAGTIADINERKIVVSRTLLGRPQEKRTFVINADTKMNKAALKPKLRVTVRYQHGNDGDVALEIQLQTPRPSSRPS